MKPRSFGEAFGMTFLLMFVPSLLFPTINRTQADLIGWYFLGIIASGALIQTLGALVVSVPCALLAARSIRGEAISREYSDAKNIQAAVENLTVYLAGIGYNQESRTDGLITFKPPWYGFLAGRIHVLLKANRVEVVGPVYYIKKLRSTFYAS